MSCRDISVETKSAIMAFVTLTRMEQTVEVQKAQLAELVGYIPEHDMPEYVARTERHREAMDRR